MWVSFGRRAALLHLVRCGFVDASHTSLNHPVVSLCYKVENELDHITRGYDRRDKNGMMWSVDLRQANCTSRNSLAGVRVGYVR